MLISMADKYNFGDHAYAMLGNLLGKTLENTWKEDNDLLNVGSFMAQAGIKIKDKSQSKQYYFVLPNQENLEGDKNNTSKIVKQEIPKDILIDLDLEVKKKLNSQLILKLDEDKTYYKNILKSNDYAESAKKMSARYRTRYNLIYDALLKSELEYGKKGVAKKPKKKSKINY